MVNSTRIVPKLFLFLLLFSYSYAFGTSQQGEDPVSFEEGQSTGNLSHEVSYLPIGHLSVGSLLQPFLEGVLVVLEDRIDFKESGTDAVVVLDPGTAELDEVAMGEGTMSLGIRGMSVGS